MTASSIQQMTRKQIMTLFDINTHEDVESGVPGVSMSKPVSCCPTHNTVVIVARCTSRAHMMQRLPVVSDVSRAAN
jgi:hypothetical protein